MNGLRHIGAKPKYEQNTYERRAGHTVSWTQKHRDTHS